MGILIKPLPTQKTMNLESIKKSSFGIAFKASRKSLALFTITAFIFALTGEANLYVGVFAMIYYGIPGFFISIPFNLITLYAIRKWGIDFNQGMIIITILASALFLALWLISEWINYMLIFIIIVLQVSFNWYWINKAFYQVENKN